MPNVANMLVPTGVSLQEKRFAESVKENLDVLLGHRGEPIDKAVTFRDLVEADVVALSGCTTSTFDGNLGAVRPQDTQRNIENPHAPTNLSATGAFRTIMLSWLMTRYVGHDRFEIHRSTSNNISTANLLTSLPGYTQSYADVVGDSGGNAKTYYYWVRAINKNEVIGPFNAVSGVQGTTQTDVSVLLSTLQGSILNSTLNSSLQSTIAKIDPNEAVITNMKNMYTVKIQATQALTVSGLPSTGTLSATNGSSTITCNHSSATGVLVGDIVNISNANSLGGAITSTILNGRHIVTARSNTSFTFTAENDTAAVLATSSDTGNGGGSISLQYYAPYVSGFGLSNTSDLSGNPTSAFIVNAEKFAVVSPNNASRVTSNEVDKMPFVVVGSQETDATTGIVTQPGVYMRNAFMSKATIVNLIAGNVTADFIKSGVVQAAGTIWAPSINMGQLSQPDVNKPWNWTWTNNSTRNFNFSVDSSGNMHSNSAKVCALTIYPTQSDLDNNTNIIFDSNGFNGTYIKDASIDTLSIADNAVTVPAGDSATGLNYNVGGSLVDISGYTVLNTWDANGVPESLIVAGQAGFLGGDTSGTTSDFATGVVKFIIEFRNNQGTYTEITSSSISTIAYQSFRAGFGGQVTSTNHIDVPSWSRGARVKMQARNDLYFSNSSYSSSRKVDKYGFFVLGAKR